MCIIKKRLLIKNNLQLFKTEFFIKKIKNLLKVIKIIKIF